MMWEGHLVQMEDGQLPNGAQTVKRRIKGGRPQLKREDCFKKDAKKSKKDEKGREKAADREKIEAVHQCKN